MGVHFNLPKFTDCDSNQQRAGYGEARRGGKSLKDLPLQSCQPAAQILPRVVAPPLPIFQKKRLTERLVFFFGIFLCGGDYFNLLKFTDCDSNQQRAGYGEARRAIKSLSDIMVKSCQSVRHLHSNTRPIILPRVVAPPLPIFQKLDSSKDGSFFWNIFMWE